MCGIYGSFGTITDGAHQSFSKNLHHRGPNDCGFFYDHVNNAMLGQNRLSIIDLSDAGHQPMFDASGRYAVVFNGEIYNFKELRCELIQKGYSFRSFTDTEVILYSFREWGVHCVDNFRGMFAFVILDRGSSFGPDPVSQESLPHPPYLFIARDRFGIKPLLYTSTPNCFCFSSELGALIESNSTRRVADVSSIKDYIETGSIKQPKTILEDVHCLEAAHVMIVKKDLSKRSWRYYNLLDGVKQSQDRLGIKSSDEDYFELTRYTLEKATKYNLIADVPVGAFLSGGIDSTAVVALMAKYCPYPIRTFTIGFDAQHEVDEETVYAAQAAEKLGCKHTSVILESNDIANNFEKLITSIDQPSFDGTNTFFVSQVASKEVRVALSGLGGDELFGGYRHLQEIGLSRCDRFSVLQKMAGRYLYELRPNKFLRKCIYSADPAHAIQLQRMFFSSIHQKKILSPDVLAKKSQLNCEAMNDDVPSDFTRLQKSCIFEIQNYLQNTLLRDSDIMSMAHSLEVRPVLLDQDLVELALSLPDHTKISVDRTKIAFVEAVKKLIPSDCWKRKKLGFEMPLKTWMSSVLYERLSNAVNSDSAKVVLSKAYKQLLTKRIASGKIEKRDWLWLILFSWMEKKDVSI